MKNNRKIETQNLLSTLWIFILFNILFRDIHQLITKNFIEEILSGVVNGVTITEELLLIGGLFVEVPIIMVLLSKILPYKWNRYANIFGGVITILVTLSNSPSDMDDLFFMIIEIIALLAIIWFAWRWTSSAQSSN